MANASIAVQRIPELSKAPFRSRFNRSFPIQTTIYPDGVFPIMRDLRMFPGDTVDLSVDLKMTMLYRTAPMVDALEVNIYCFYSDYRQLYNKYTRVRGERLSASDDTNIYRLPKMTSIYPVIAFHPSNSSSTTYARVLKWYQNQKEIIPQVFDTSTGQNVPATIKYKNGHVYGQYLRDNFNVNAQTSEVGKEFNVGFAIGSLPDYLGMMPGVAPLAVDATPAIMYYLLCDKYFRNQEMFDSVVGLVPDVDKDRVWNIWSEWQGMSPHYNYAYGSVLKFYPPYVVSSSLTITDPDYSAMEMLSGIGPGGIYRASRKPDYQALALNSPTYHGIEVAIPGATLSPDALSIVPDGNLRVKGLGVSTPTSNANMQVKQAIANTDAMQIYANVSGANHFPLTYLSGLKLEASGAVTPGTMEELRNAWQMVQYFQAKNVAGKYIQDIIGMMFGVHDPAPDDRFPQLLKVLTGSFNFIANVQQSEATASSPQGNITTSGVCNISGKLCHKSTIYDAHIQVVAVIRQPSVVFEDRIEPWWFIEEELEHPWPQFARLSDEPVYNYEVYTPAISGYGFIGSSSTRFTVPSSGEGEDTTHSYFVDEITQNYLNDMWKPYGYQERYGSMKYGYPYVSAGFRMRGAFVPQYRWPATAGYIYQPLLADYVAAGRENNRHTHFYLLQKPQTDWNLNVSYDSVEVLPSGFNDARKMGFLGREPRQQNSINYTSGDTQLRQLGTQCKSITPWDKAMFDSVDVPPIQVIGQAYCYYDSVLPVHSLPGLADHFCV